MSPKRLISLISLIVDANILIFAADRESRFHERASAWLEGALNGGVRIGLPWESTSAFLRIATHPRGGADALDGDVAYGQVRKWLAAPAAWIPTPAAGHAELLGGLISRYEIRGNLIPDAHLAALALSHGVGVASADTDFARFEELRWLNPLAG